MSSTEPHATEVVVRLTNGLHLAPAMQIVRTAQQFRAEFSIRKGDRVVDGKSMLDLMTLAAEHGATLRLEARGADAADALSAVEALFERNFAIDGVSVDRAIAD